MIEYCFGDRYLFGRRVSFDELKEQLYTIEKKYDRINLTVPKGNKEIIQAAAKRTGESVNSFINRLIDAELRRLEGEQMGDGYGNFEPGDVKDLCELLDFPYTE